MLGRIRHVPHRRSRPIPDPAPARIAGRVCRPGEPGSLYRSLCRWTGSDRGGFRPRGVQGDRAAGLCTRGSPEALRLRLPQPGAIEPPSGGGDPPQYRSHLAAAASEARLQDHCRRRDNRNAFRPVFRQFVLLCRQMDLFGRELLAVDGTRIEAVNNKDRNFTWASLSGLVAGVIVDHFGYATDVTEAVWAPLDALD